VAQRVQLFPADQVEEIVDGVTDLYRHCANKDIFVALYQRHLTKRLLLYIHVSLSLSLSLTHKSPSV
jgi:hypothetical protein